MVWVQKIVELAALMNLMDLDKDNDDLNIEDHDMLIPH